LRATPRTDPYVRNYRIRLLPWVRTTFVVRSTSRCHVLPGAVSGMCKVREPFPLVSSLPSTDSADGGTPSLFAGFFGTMELSDSTETCMSDVRHRAFSDRSASREADVSGVSRLPRGKFPTVLVVLDSVGETSDLPYAFDITVAFPVTG